MDRLDRQNGHMGGLPRGITGRERGLYIKVSVAWKNALALGRRLRYVGGWIGESIQKGAYVMQLAIRKLIVLLLIGGILLVGNIMLIANWLNDHGVIDGARSIRKEFLTGTAITIIVVLMILLVGPRVRMGVGERSDHCSVCDQRLSRGDRYCGSCGSRV